MDSTPNGASSCSSSSAPMPQFRVGSGDSSTAVTVAAALSGSSLPGVPPLDQEGSEPISQSSDDHSLKLSLVSWYSEVEGPSSEASSCCDGRQAVSMSMSATAGTTSQLVISSKGEEKENLVPENPKNSENGEQTKLGLSAPSGSSESVLTLRSQEDLKLISSTAIDSERKTRSHKNKVKLVDADKSNVTPLSSKFLGNGKSNSNSASCLKCTRSLISHLNSASRTPASASRRLMVSTKSSSEIKKPIKSILKSDSGKSGSGSDNKSSMDSVHSADRMTRSCDSKVKPPGQGFRRIERYATLRFRSKKGKEEDATEDASHPQNQALMTKSLTFLEKEKPGGSNGTLKRQGSVRGKGPSPNWEPCLTRTTALRLQKMQEAKNKQHQQGSGESLAHPSQQPEKENDANNKGHARAHWVKGYGPQHPGKEKGVFYKLASAQGQTASSNQKRLKQERGVQTEQEPLPGERASSSRSPTPAAVETDRVKELEGLLERLGGTVLRLQSELNSSEKQREGLNRQLMEAEQEHAEIIHFLQDEKAALFGELRDKYDDKLEAKKQEDAAKHKLLVSRLEAQANSYISTLTYHLAEGTGGIRQLRQKVMVLVEGLMKSYRITDSELENFTKAQSTKTGSSANEKATSAQNFGGTGILTPLITLLGEAFPELGLESKNAASTSEAEKNGIDGEKEKGFGDLKVEANNVDPRTLDLIKVDDLKIELQRFDEPQLVLEVESLREALRKLLYVVKMVLGKCDVEVGKVTTSILQCLHDVGVNDATVGEPDKGREDKGEGVTATVQLENGSTD